MKISNSKLFGMLAAAAFVGAAAVYFFFVKKPTMPEIMPSPTPTVSPKATPKVTPTPTPTASPTSQIPAGWQTYTNGKYGFQISYPSEYKALSDKDNLSGYPNGVVLLYNGGQAYDIVIEAWNTKSEYQAKYPAGTAGLTVEIIAGKYITVYDATKESGNADVIKTFKAIK